MSNVPMTMGLVSTGKKRKTQSKTITDKRRIREILRNAENMGEWFDNDPSGRGNITSQYGRYKGRGFRVDYDTSGPMPILPDDSWYEKIAYRITWRN